MQTVSKSLNDTELPEILQEETALAGCPRTGHLFTYVTPNAKGRDTNAKGHDTNAKGRNGPN